MTIEVKFIDEGRKSTSPSNPKYPNGVDVSAAMPDQKSCCFNVQYPAPGVGKYSIVCTDCKMTALVSVAGRADDPRTVTLPCKGKT